MKRIEDIDTYYGISSMVEEIFEDRVEAHKHLVTANKENERLHSIIKEVREELKNYRDMFIERHSAVDWRDFDFDKLIEILDKENK